MVGRLVKDKNNIFGVVGTVVQACDNTGMCVVQVGPYDFLDFMDYELEIVEDYCI